MNALTGRGVVLVSLILGLCLVWPVAPTAIVARIPRELPEREFWRLIDEFSEPAGFFNSDNLVSNEDGFQTVIPDLVRTVAPGGVYLGVGPDQNFTYISAVDPAAAFIVDVRRGNLQLHLMYKALFALSRDRGEFLSRLFSRPRPRGLPRDAGPQQLMEAFEAIEPDRALFDANLRAVLDYLRRHRRGPIDDVDRMGVEFVYGHFFAAGPQLAFVSNTGFRRMRYPTFSALQTTTDGDGVERAYLANETLFRRVKALQARNLLIPIVGNFAGPMALGAVGDWVRGHGGTVTTFYTSNVEQYLFQDRTWDRFRRNVDAMPTDRTSTFIRSCFNSCSSPGGSRAVTLLDSVQVLLETASLGRISSYSDVLAHSRRLD